MSKKNIVYAVSPSLQPQGEQICFRDCGEILFGSIIIDGRHWLPCRIKDCMYEEKNIETCFEFNLDNSTIWIRRLKSLDGIEHKELP